MNKDKLFNSIVWMCTILTLVLWMPVIAMGMVMLKQYMTASDAVSIGIIGGADGPTSIYMTTTAFMGGAGDFLLLGGAVVVTIILWIIKIKYKKEQNT